MPPGQPPKAVRTSGRDGAVWLRRCPAGLNRKVSSRSSPGWSRLRSPHADRSFAASLGGPAERVRGPGEAARCRSQRRESGVGTARRSWRRQVGAAGSRDRASDGTGSRTVPYGALSLAAFRGHEDDAARLIEACTSDSIARGEGNGLTLTQWATAVLCNGLARYTEALAAAEGAAEDPRELWF